MVAKIQADAPLLCPEMKGTVAEKNDVIENPFFTHFNADSCEMILLLQTDLI